MIHYPNNNEEIELPRDGCEGDEPVMVGQSSDTPYTLFAVPRWNKDIGIVERVYEVFNTETGVTEHRARTNLATAASVFETLCNLHKELREAGTVEAMNEAQESGHSNDTGPTLQ